MNTSDLRPLNTPELMDRIFSLYRGHFGLFVGIAIGPALLTAVLTVEAQALLRFLTPLIDEGQPSDGAMLLIGLTVLGVSFAFAGISILITAVAMTATTVAVSEVYMGRPSSILSAYRTTARRALDVAALVLLIVAILFGSGILAAFIGGFLGFALSVVNPILGGLWIFAWLVSIGIGTVIFLLRFGVALPALVVETIGPIRAMKRSTLLTVGHRLRVFLIYFLMLVISYAAAFLFQGPFLLAGILVGGAEGPPFWTEALGAISGAIGGSLVQPLVMIGFVLLYYDLRVRREGMDLDLLMEAASPPPSAEGV